MWSGETNKCIVKNPLVLRAPFCKSTFTSLFKKLFLMYTHYRKHISFTETMCANAANIIPPYNHVNSLLVDLDIIFYPH